ncbi:IS1 family transposase, partial [Salmonella enterica]|uniref:IS1 family transposase n=1 Tax=Salmonella enterica TaxID=28901 RepID=UPI000B1138F5
MASVSISCPSCSATDGVVRNGKSTAGHQRYLCSHCRKTWQWMTDGWPLYESRLKGKLHVISKR